MSNPPDRDRKPAPAWTSEEELINTLFAPLAKDIPGAFGLRDDAACLSPPAGKDFVVSTDGVVAGIHLPPTADPYDVAWKALAANVSDVIAKGGKPYAYLMTLMLPDDLDPAWLKRFVQGLADAQEKFGIHLAGGDTDSAHGVTVPAYSVGITMFANVASGAYVQRTTAQPEECIVVTGPIGHPTLGLRLETRPEVCKSWQLAREEREELISSYLRPTPNIKIADAIAANASAAIDISDGLIKDVQRLCRTSGVGARLEAHAVPHGSAACSLLNANLVTQGELLTGGEDYCVALTLPPGRLKAFKTAALRAGAIAIRIGQTVSDPKSFDVIDSHGNPVNFDQPGWDHIQKV